MHTNTLLAVVIVLVFLLAFLAWLGAMLIVLSDLVNGDAAPADALGVFIPGAVLFTFWFTVAWRLYNCPGTSLEEDLGFGKSEEKK